MTFIADEHRRPNAWKSAGAVLAGVLTVVLLSIATDIALQRAHVLPPMEEGLHDPLLNVLVLAYRCLYNVIGAIVVVRLAPRNPTRHLWVFALIGLALGTLGAVVMIPKQLGPA